MVFKDSDKVIHLYVDQLVFNFKSKILIIKRKIQRETNLNIDWKSIKPFKGFSFCHIFQLALDLGSILSWKDWGKWTRKNGREVRKSLPINEKPNSILVEICCYFEGIDWKDKILFTNFQKTKTWLASLLNNFSREKVICEGKITGFSKGEARREKEE